MEKRWTLKQAAAEVGVSRPTMYRWIERGHVTPTCQDADGRPLFTRDEITAMRKLLK
jgi:predicted site-specific integrase-resolvase